MKQILAEFFATFLMIFAVLECVIWFAGSDAMLALGMVALVSGIAVTLLIVFFGKISGAHMNPAVSTAIWLDRQLSFSMLSGYTAAQFAGALGAALLVDLIHPDGYTMGNTLPSISLGLAWVLEFGLTMILMGVIYWSTDKRNPRLNKIASILIGVAIIIEILVAGALCGASMNPARSLGPAIVSGKVGFLWIYLTAPIAGAVVARYANQIFSERGKS